MNIAVVKACARWFDSDVDASSVNRTNSEQESSTLDWFANGRWSNVTSKLSKASWLAGWLTG